jgi:hypothetical protein
VDRRNFLARAGSLAVGLTAAGIDAAAAAPISDADMLRRVHTALDHHRAHIMHRDLVGVVNFGLHSSQPRFQLVNLESGRIDCFLVAHGHGSDPEQTGWLKRFSNKHGSLASSQGSYVTGERYVGQYGNSRRLVGLEPENSEAYARAIVIHSASFVSAARAEKRDVGCSFGCFVFAKADIDTVLDRLGPDRLLLAFKA